MRGKSAETSAFTHLLLWRKFGGTAKFLACLKAA